LIDKNIKLTWKTENEIIIEPNSKDRKGNEFFHQNNTLREPKEITDKFNGYLINVEPNLAKNIEHKSANVTHVNFLNGNWNDIVFFTYMGGGGGGPQTFFFNFYLFPFNPFC